MLFQHDPKEPIGIWEVAREDGYGLWVEGRLVPGVPRADALRALIERRAIDGLSIGFRTVRATREAGTRASPALGGRPVGSLDRDVSDAGGSPHRRRRDAGIHAVAGSGHFASEAIRENR